MTTKDDLIAAAQEYARLHREAEKATTEGDLAPFKLNNDKVRAAVRLIDVALQMEVPAGFARH